MGALSLTLLCTNVAPKLLIPGQSHPALPSLEFFEDEAGGPSMWNLPSTSSVFVFRVPLSIIGKIVFPTLWLDMPSSGIKIPINTAFGGKGSEMVDSSLKTLVFKTTVLQKGKRRLLNSKWRRGSKVQRLNIKTTGWHFCECQLRRPFSIRGLPVVREGGRGKGGGSLGL